MDRFEFTRDMDAYLSRRKRKGFKLFWPVGLKSVGFLSSKHVVASKVNDIVPQTVKYSEPVEVAVSVDNKDVSVEYEVKDKSVFSRFVGWIVEGRQAKGEDVSFVGVESALAEKELLSDLRELARISILHFRKLPAHKIRELKQSEDFLVFKGILNKHGLSRD